MSRFRPGLAPTLVVLALLPLLVWLGFWQLQRADEKRALLAEFQNHMPRAKREQLSRDIIRIG